MLCPQMLRCNADFVGPTTCSKLIIEIIGKPIVMCGFDFHFQICIEEYGSSGAMLILAGLGFNIVISGFLTRSPYPCEIQRGSAKSKECTLLSGDKIMDTNDQYTITNGNKAKSLDSYSTHEGRKDNTKSEATDIQETYIFECEIKVPNVTTERRDNKYCNMRLYRNPQFVAYSLITASGQASSSMMFTHFAGLTSERGISMRHSSYLLALTGVFIIFARFISSILFDIRAIRQYRREVMGVIFTVMGLSMVGFSLLVSVPGFLSCWVVYVCSQAVFGVQYGAVLTDIVGRDDYIVAIGLLRFVWCFGYVSGPSVGGKFE